MRIWATVSGQAEISRHLSFSRCLSVAVRLLSLCRCVSLTVYLSFALRLCSVCCLLLAVYMSPGEPEIDV